MGIWKAETRIQGTYKLNVAAMEQSVREYELTNHLGNVLSTITDKGVITSAQDYFPFGLTLASRSFTEGGSPYRYSFNGKEDDKETGLQDYGMRIYRMDLGRFLSVDPISRQYPELTPYQFASNTPILAVDIDGLEAGLDMRFAKWDAQLASGKKTSQQIEKEMQAHGIGGVMGGLIVLAAYTGGEAIPLVAPYVLRIGMWSLNPVNQYNLAAAGYTVAGLLDPDPSHDYPGAGDDIARGIKLVLKNSSGKVVEFMSEAGASFANVSEKSWVTKLLEEGKNVTLLAEKQQLGKNGDFLVDGVQTELKTVTDISKSNIASADKLSEAIKGRIKDASGQGKNLIIDVTGQEGASYEITKRAVARYYGAGGTKDQVRVVGQGFDEVLTKEQFKKQ